MTYNLFKSIYIRNNTPEPEDGTVVSDDDIALAWAAYQANPDAFESYNLQLAEQEALDEQFTRSMNESSAVPDDTTSNVDMSAVADDGLGSGEGSGSGTKSRKDLNINWNPNDEYHEWREQYVQNHATKKDSEGNEVDNDNAERNAKRWTNAARTMKWVGLGSDIVSSFLPENTAYSGDKGETTSTIDQAYDSATNLLAGLGPYGLIASGALKGFGALNKGLSALGVGTDGMTTMDSIMSSNLFGWNIGLVNSLGAKTTDKINKDYDTFALSGSSYTGTSNLVDEAVHKSDKKYGLFSGGAYNRALELIHNAQLQLLKLSDITKAASNRSALKSSMSGTNTVRRQLAMNGGYRQGSVRAGLRGMILMPRVLIANILNAAKGAKIDIMNRYGENYQGTTEDGSMKLKNPYYQQYDTSNIVSLPMPSVTEFDTKTDTGADNSWFKGNEISRGSYVRSMQEGSSITPVMPIFDNGGEIEYDNSWIKEVPLIDVEGYNNMTYEQLIDALIDAVKALDNPPRFILRLNEDPRGIWFVHDGIMDRGSHMLGSGEANGMYIVYPSILEIDGKLRYIPDWRKAMDIALENGNYLKFANEELAELFANENYKKGWPEYMSNFKTTKYDNTISEADPEMMAYLGNPDISKLKIIFHNGDAYTSKNKIYIDINREWREQLAHELTHYLYDNGILNADKYKAYWSDINDKKLADMGADMRFIKRAGDPGVFYEPVELLARINAARLRSLADALGWLPTFFGLVRHTDENMYGDNFRDLLHMFGDETLSEIFKLTPVVSFLHGGTMNVIPDGALHKERHGMEKMEGLEDVTRKGIPVVSEEEGGEIVQQAEIERSELILRLEVTEKIEELYKTYYDENSSSEEKDAAAIEAGKLLAEEIMHNTDDLTNNII